MRALMPDTMTDDDAFTITRFKLQTDMIGFIERFVG
jgi:hypothetical protein